MTVEAFTALLARLGFTIVEERRSPKVREGTGQISGRRTFAGTAPTIRFSTCLVRRCDTQVIKDFGHS
jgi:hypothetical protein